MKLASSISSETNKVSVEELMYEFEQTRALSVSLIESLSEADCQIQSMPDASPAKWHLAHTSWFFETFILKKFLPDYSEFSAQFDVLFNSYYNAVGEQFSRPNRGVLSRPSLAKVLEYRAHINTAMQGFVQSENCPQEVIALLEIGIQHEKQHQELLLTDIQHGLYQNPLLPAYAELDLPSNTALAPLRWINFPGGLVEIGADPSGYAFDNERPRHKHYLEPFRLASRTVTNGEYLEFIEDGGYQRSELWLADGWSWVLENYNKGSNLAPLYWQKREDVWHRYSLAGLQKLEVNQPACNINYFEASAYAAWAGKRLPTEFEWECASHTAKDAPNYLHLDKLQTQVASESGLTQMFGDLWEWTASSYLGYPGFKPFAGDAGEYNGKFMSGQFVLRGGSCVSPENHIRSSYRNFFYPYQSWQYSGIRLAEDS